MVATRSGQRLNGLDVDELRAYIDSVTADAAQADRDPTVVARWVGGTRAEVVSTLGGPPVYMGGDDDPSAMGMRHVRFFFSVPPASLTLDLPFTMTSPKAPSRLIKLPECHCKASRYFL